MTKWKKAFLCNYLVFDISMLPQYTIKQNSIMGAKKDVYLVDKAQSDPAATTYFAGPQPTYSKAKGRELFSSSR